MEAVVAQSMRGYCLVSARGHIDSRILEQLVGMSVQSGDRNVWVDCRAVTSITTEALRSVLSLSGRAEKEGVCLVFYQLSPALKSVLQEAGLDRVLCIMPGIAAVYRHYRRKKNQ